MNLVVKGGEPERLASAAVTPDVLPLGVAPLLGTVFNAKTGAPGSSHGSDRLGCWRSMLAGESSVLGRTLNLEWCAA